MATAAFDFDLIVVGGGISGLGVAHEAAQQGFSVLVLEKDRCCRATSANSLRIIHGGFRYLQSFDLARVIESALEQNYWLQTVPHVVKPLPCFLPLQRFGFKSKWPLKIASLAYEALSYHCCGRANGSRLVSSDYVEQHVPALKGLVPYGALLWHDALLEDVEVFVDFVKARAEKAGAVLREMVRVTEIAEADSGFVVKCASADGGGEFAAPVVINTTGPWLSSVGLAGQAQSGAGRKKFPAGWCLACNIVLKRQLEQRYAFGITSPGGRVLFFVPRADKTAAGTWYVPFNSSPDEVKMDEGVLKVFLEAIRQCVPGMELGLSDVETVESGVLPMRRCPGSGPVLYGSHRIESHGGFINVMSTKFTTFRSQGRDVIDLARPFVRARGE